jgi:hypothetical protein
MIWMPMGDSIGRAAAHRGVSIAVKN